MSQIECLLGCLKQELKSRGMTYADLGEMLDISEASVKRIFSIKEVSLSRLESICHCLQLTLSDCFAMLDNNIPRLKYLSIEQEQALVNDTTLLIIAVSVMNHWQFDDLRSHYQFNEFEIIQKLAALDKMKLIDLLPGNRIRSRLHPDFDWLPNGPIQTFFNKNLMQDFFNSTFSDDKEFLMIRSGMLSDAQIVTLQKRLKSTAKTFVENCHKERKLSVNDKSGVALIIALRPWIPQTFLEKKHPNEIKD